MHFSRMKNKTGCGKIKGECNEACRDDATIDFRGGYAYVASEKENLVRFTLDIYRIQF